MPGHTVPKPANPLDGLTTRPRQILGSWILEYGNSVFFRRKAVSKLTRKGKSHNLYKGHNTARDSKHCLRCGLVFPIGER